MQQHITSAAIRIKITGICNRTCTFCHEEGDMVNIGSVEAAEHFFQSMAALQEKLGCRRVMLTGGEPTVHPELAHIISGLACEYTSITSNGIVLKSADAWRELRARGLKQLIVSAHDASAEDLLGLEKLPRRITWAENALRNQCQNVENAAAAGLNVRVNTVVHGSAEKALAVLMMLKDAQLKWGVDIRLLNDLSNIEQSQAEIARIVDTLGAEQDASFRRAASSNATTYWHTKDGFRFSSKIAYPYFFEPVCGGCTIRDKCHEGYYGVRVERRGDYWVRLCIYKQSRDVLMPLGEFLAGDLPAKLRLIADDELS